MTEYPELAVSKNYSLTFPHIAKVSDMAQRLGVSHGKIVRDAIDLYYEKLEADEVEAEKEPAAEG